MASALFANQRETNLASTLVLIEDALTELGHVVATARTDAHGALHAWHIQQGSAATRVTLVNRTEFSHMRVWAVVMTLTAAVDRESLFAHLLGLNATMAGAAFALDGDHVLLVSERSTLDIDKSEIVDTIRKVSTAADDHDDVLVARFGGARGEAAAT